MIRAHEKFLEALDKIATKHKLQLVYADFRGKGYVHFQREGEFDSFVHASYEYSPYENWCRLYRDEERNLMLREFGGVAQMGEAIAEIERRLIDRFNEESARSESVSELGAYSGKSRV